MDSQEGSVVADQGTRVINHIEVFLGKQITLGSNGSVVYEGMYEGRREAVVKCLVNAHSRKHAKEIDNLYAADKYPNIIRLYGYEKDRNFTYLAMERYDYSLYDLVRDNEAYANLWGSENFPCSNLLNLMRGIVDGVATLHALGIIHQDLNPLNVLIVVNQLEGLCVKISDMGINKRVDEPGWRDPDQHQRGDQTWATDMFSLGCVLFFCMTRSEHRFGHDRFARWTEMQIMQFQDIPTIPEAKNLISQLLNPTPALRPQASMVKHHPLFWNSERRMSFIRQTSDWIESEDGKFVIPALEKERQKVFSGYWTYQIQREFVTIMNTKRGKRTPYSYGMLRDLLRFIRNTMNHYQTLPLNIQVILGAMPEGIDNYFRIRFPKLLMVVYNTTYPHFQARSMVL